MKLLKRILWTLIIVIILFIVCFITCLGLYILENNVSDLIFNSILSGIIFIGVFCIVRQIIN